MFGVLLMTACMLCCCINICPALCSREMQLLVLMALQSPVALQLCKLHDIQASLYWLVSAFSHVQALVESFIEF